jgi:hypothetical protein
MIPKIETWFFAKETQNDPRKVPEGDQNGEIRVDLPVEVLPLAHS